jgi:formate-dependent phosphoribosylglycinamide formyltransferase (GAR transformylase)
LLLVATLRWPIAARLAIAFARLGCHIDVVCPRGHPIESTTGIVDRLHRYSTVRPSASLYHAIVASTPDYAIPCDDDAAVLLSGLHESIGANSSDGVRALVERSLGVAEGPRIATARGRLMAIAEQLGVRVPERATLGSSDELLVWLDRYGYPGVIKTDRSWGGQGVAVVRNRDEAVSAFRRATALPSVPMAFARTLLDRELTPLIRVLAPIERRITVQRFIDGTPANRAVACWHGRVLAGTNVEALRTQHSTGPATVARVIDSREMDDSVMRIVEHLGVSGLWGVDFIIEASTGAAYLIEVNPRATPICHLPLGHGHDLPAALVAQWTDAPVAEATNIDRDVIALFPGEWQRDLESPFLSSAYLDVPWEQRGLIADCLDKPWSERGLVARAWRAVHPKSSARAIADRRIDANFDDADDATRAQDPFGLR